MSETEPDASQAAPAAEKTSQPAESAAPAVPPKQPAESANANGQPQAAVQEGDADSASEDGTTDRKKGTDAIAGKPDEAPAKTFERLLTEEEIKFYKIYKKIVAEAWQLLPEDSNNDNPDQQQLRKALEIDKYLDKADETVSAYDYKTGNFQLIGEDGVVIRDNFNHYAKIIIDTVEKAGKSTDELKILKPRLDITDKGTDKEGYRIFYTGEVRTSKEIIESSVLTLVEQMLRYAVNNKFKMETTQRLLVHYVSLRFGLLSPEAQIRLLNETLTHLDPQEKALFANLFIAERYTGLDPNRTIERTRNFEDLTGEIRFVDQQNMLDGADPLAEWLIAKFKLNGVSETDAEAMRNGLTDEIAKGNGMSFLLSLEGANFQKLAQSNGRLARFFQDTLGIDIASVTSENPIVKELIDKKIALSGICHDIFGLDKGFTPEVIAKLKEMTGINLDQLTKEWGRKEGRKITLEGIGMIAMLSYSVIAPLIAEADQEKE